MTQAATQQQPTSMTPTINRRRSRGSLAARFRQIDWHGEEGSGGGMSLLMLGAAVALMMILGLIVDGGAKARALDHAGAIAAARDYLAAAGATGSIAVAGMTVTATATLTARTVFLPLVGIDEFTVTGDGQAQVAYDPGGAP